jgi:hypothetical protein
MMHTKKATQHIVLIISVFLLLFLPGCNKKEKIQTFINPPLPNADIPFETLRIDPTEADTIDLPMGTKLLIPPNAFVDSAGNYISDSVTIKYREFRNAAEIFLAGIPMNFNTLNNHTALETAGMFEIRALSKKRKLELAYGSAITIKMGSRVEGNDYNFFGFDETNGTWNFSGYPETETNPTYETIEENIDKLSKQRKYPLDNDFFVFDYTSAYDVTYYQLGKNFGKKQIKARINKYGAKLYNMYTYDRVTFRGQHYDAQFMLWKNLSKKPLPRWVRTKRTTTTLSKIKGNTYLLKVKLDKRTFTFKAEIKMPLKMLYAYAPDYLIKNYEEAMQELDKEHERLATEAKVFRTFELTQLGVANFDKLYIPEDALYVLANYHADFIEDKALYQGGRIFIVPGSRKSYITLTGFIEKKIAIDRSDTALMMFTILPGNEIGIIDASNMEQLNLPETAERTTPKIDLPFRKWEHKFESREDVMKLFGL